MQTSSVRHPSRSRYLQIFDWQLEVTDSNVPSAALINFFAYHHDRLLAGLGEAQLTGNKASRAGWQYHTDEVLADALLGVWKKQSINAGILRLVDLGFLEVNPPKEFEAKGFRAFRFRADVVRMWLDSYTARTFPSNNGAAVHKVAAPSSTQKRRKAATDILKGEKAEFIVQAREVFNDWKIVHGHPTSNETPERLKYIIKLLKADYSVTRLKIASRGVLFSDFHQGRHEKNMTKVWDKISIIFENGEKVEGFEELARQNGVTENNLDKFIKKPKAETNLDKPDWKREIDNCPLCDERGYQETEAGVAVCTHPKQ